MQEKQYTKGYQRIIASGQVFTGKAVLSRIILTGNGAAATLKVYDDTGVNPATERGHIEAANGKTEAVEIKHLFKTGIYVTIAGANAIADVYFDETK